MTSPSTDQWFKSTYSGGSGTECVECALDRSITLVRDSKQESGPFVAVQHQAWDFFVDALRRGELDN
ncbi:DUF397 domain-containing protein [Streptomyces sp900129855]|jgi:hypothetical protein|uniref:DUF397 domain-containing protein n=1 Tax=Streptomyces sp. 900129855 TaxID=3155129 RepID=A0ABV2ZBD4_9ACTN